MAILTLLEVVYAQNDETGQLILVDTNSQKGMAFDPDTNMKEGFDEFLAHVNGRNSDAE